MTLRDVQQLQHFTEILWGSELWRVTPQFEHVFGQGYTAIYLNTLLLEFRILQKYQRLGSILFDTDACGLRLDQNGVVLTADGDSQTRLLAFLPHLVGDTLQRVDVTPPAGDTALHFESGKVLRCFNAVSAEKHPWTLETTEGDRLTLGPGASWTYQSGRR